MGKCNSKHHSKLQKDRDKTKPIWVQQNKEH